MNSKLLVCIHVFRWTNCVTDFNMPVKIMVNDTEKWLYPQTNWKYETNIDKNSKVTINPDFYVKGIHIKNKID